MEELVRYRYTKREQQFLEYVKGCGGFFTRQQYDEFAVVKAGGPSNRLVDRALGFGHIRERCTAGRKIMYQWLGPDREARTRSTIEAAIRGLIALDFVVAHRGKFEIAVSEKAKKQVLLARRGVTPSMIPEPYGIEPVFTANGVTGFCFVEESSRFVAWLADRARLLMAIGTGIVVYLGACKSHILAAREALADMEKKSVDHVKVSRYLELQGRWNSESTRTSLTLPEIREYKILTTEMHGLDVDRLQTQGVIHIAFSVWSKSAANYTHSLFSRSITRQRAKSVSPQVLGAEKAEFGASDSASDTPS